ncbi:MAG: hypothetical protein D6788_02360, partial [Planctomycetota bacterium]
CRVRTVAAPMILSTLRNTALNLLRAAGVSNIAAALRRHAARPREALALIHAKDDFRKTLIQDRSCSRPPRHATDEESVGGLTIPNAGIAGGSALCRSLPLTAT